MLLADPMPQVVFVHHPIRYALLLLGAQPWDDPVFSFHGDVRQEGNQINMVEWPASPFYRFTMVTIPVLDHMDKAWANTAGVDEVGPYVANDPNTEQAWARFLCSVPH
jgi:hypothetical protein